MLCCDGFETIFSSVSFKVCLTTLPHTLQTFAIISALCSVKAENVFANMVEPSWPSKNSKFQWVFLDSSDVLSRNYQPHHFLLRNHCELSLLTNVFSRISDEQALRSTQATDCDEDQKFVTAAHQLMIFFAMASFPGKTVESHSPPRFMCFLHLSSLCVNRILCL